MNHSPRTDAETSSAWLSALGCRVLLYKSPTPRSSWTRFRISPRAYIMTNHSPRTDAETSSAWPFTLGYRVFIYRRKRITSFTTFYPLVPFKSSWTCFRISPRTWVNQGARSSLLKARCEMLKFAIEREQRQACLSYAEREQIERS